MAEGAPPQSLWLRAADGIRLRAAIWDSGSPEPKGTVILLPGRTEYVEKYSSAAQDLIWRGYGVLCIDWRGQGLSDRALDDPMAGHVDRFDEYQSDLDALVQLAEARGLPRPFFLMSHSMGGCIALRGLIHGLPVKAAVFSAPMWGIAMAPWMRPAAHLIGAAARWTGQRHRYAPSTNAKSYVAAVPFQGNVLTTDPAMFDWMRRQVVTHAELSLGGPSLGWLNAALEECADLAARASPQIPCVTALGTAEKVVAAPAVHLRMARWPHGRLDLYPGAEHEVMMEPPATRARFFDAAAALFEANR